MTFVFPFLLGGLVLVGIPVLIHLIMRQKPKTLPFPAFRFLVQRHRTNLRKLRLRHLLLLALRIGLIILICLALARPKVFNEALKLGTDRPVAAILVFDTSRSMEYTVTSPKGKLTRLDDARRRGRELLTQLPDGSKVLVLDTADPTLSGKGEWFSSMHQAAQRIDGLALRDGGGPVTARLEDAYRLFNELARAKGDEAARHQARLLVVFSDRTLASWDAGRLRPLQDARDQVPPPFERLPQLRDRVPGVVELLRDLRQRLPLPAGQDYPEQALIDLLEKARDRAAGLSEDEYPDPELSKLLTAARGRTRDLLGGLEKISKEVSAGAKEYHAKLLDVLHGLLHDLRGVHEVYIDVGVDEPADGALLDFELPRSPRQNLPRQVFAADEKVIVRAALKATGKGLDNMLRWTLDGKPKLEQAVKLKAGEKASFAFTIDCKGLTAGEHQLRADLVTPDLLPSNNTRYLTFAVRQPRDILVLSDDPRKAARWKDAHDSLRESGIGAFRVTLKTPTEATKGSLEGLKGYQAIYLFDVAEPAVDLWNLLKRYVQSGGGLGVVPGGDELKTEAYNTGEAQAVLPAALEGPVKAPGPRGVIWDLERIAYQHPMMARYREWKAERVDFVKYPPAARRFWRVKPKDSKEVTVLARYTPGEQPALLEWLPGDEGGRPGRVILFTTPLDAREPPWNDYRKTDTSFYLALAFLATTHLAGDTEPVQLNFLSGQTVPAITIPLSLRADRYLLKRGPESALQVPAETSQSVLRFPQALTPDNYTVEGEGKRVAAFSVNLPTEETVLERVPVASVEALFGKGAVVPVDVRADLRTAMSGQWSQPIELFPFLMVALLFVLAVENLLANKFYRREPEAQNS
jgi:hypothetical protein